MVHAFSELSFEAILARLYSHMFDKRVHRGITFILLLLLVSQITSIFWLFLPPKHVDAMALHWQIGKAKPVADIAAWHLLGDYQPPLSAIPTSESSLQLMGIMKAEPVEQSQVIISVNQEEKVYQLGQTLPNGAVLKQILDDAVIIEQQGHLERLALPKAELEFKPLPNATLDEVA